MSRHAAIDYAEIVEMLALNTPRRHAGRHSALMPRRLLVTPGRWLTALPPRMVTLVTRHVA